MKKSICIIMMLLPLCLFAQQDLVFKVFYKPGKQYTTELKSVTNGELNFQGDAEQLEELTASGMKLPMTVKGENSVITLITTGKQTESNLTPVRFEYKKYHIYLDAMSQIIDKDSPLANLIIFGFYDKDGKLSIDSLNNYPGSAMNKDALISAIEKTQQKIDFPDSTLKPGESFVQKIPMEIPVTGMKPITLLIDVIYTIKEINGNHAIIGIDQKLQMNTSDEQYQINATGQGSGTGDYDIENNILSNYSSNMDITLKINIEKVTMILKMKSDNNQTTTVK